MAIYYLGIKTFGRARGSEGSVATSAAAYRAGERIRDERTGAVYDHSRRTDVLHKEILLPSKFDGAGAELDWARDRVRLWNAAEQAEHRRDARVAREYVVALPHELQAGQRVELARVFAREIVERYGNGIDLALHAPKGDSRNFHAHLLATTREITPAGLGAKTALEWRGTKRLEHGLPRYRDEQRQVRERWAQLANVALRDAGLSQRISPVRALGTEYQPGARVWLPRIAWEIEKRGEHSFLGDLVRRRYAERAQAQARLTPREVATQSAMRWNAYQDSLQGTQRTAAEAAQAWARMRDQPQAARDIAAEAVRQWREQHALRAGPEPDAGRSRESAADHDRMASAGHGVAAGRDGNQRQAARPGRDEDYGL